MSGARYPLLRVTLAGLRAHAARLALTAAAVMIGVGFLAGAMVYGDTARSAFYEDMARAARNVDTVVRPAGFDGAARLPPEVVDRLRAAPGVARVDGRATETLSMLDRGGKLITNFGQVGYGLSVPAEPDLSRYGVAGGRLPERAGEIAVDRGTVTTAGFQVGQPVRVLDRGGRPHDLTLVGVLDLGVNRLFAGQSVAALEAGQLADLTSGSPLRFTEVVVTAEPGVDQATLRDRVDRVLAGDGFWVSTGDEYRRELAERAANYVDGFLRVLIGFGLVAVTVSGFVIYNTFAILAAQRRRELALLRCVGASRRQVFSTVVGESLALGVVASLGGLLLSLLIGYGLILGRELVGAVIPAHAPVVGWQTVAVAVGFGTVVTVASALVPATAASRVAPLAALRTAELTDAPLPRRAGGRLVVAVAVGGLGTAVALAGHRAGFAGLPLVLGGAMLGFLAIVAVSPLVVGRFTGAVGWLPARIFGAPARLAAVNARRNPRRVAATTTALMIGVALMSMLSVLLATARTQAGQELTENFPVEFVLEPADGEQFRAWGERFAGMDGIPDEVVAALRGHPEFGAVAEVRDARAYVDGRRARVWAVSPDGFRGPVVPEVTEGDIADLGPGTVALRRTLAWDVGVRVGDRIELDGFGEQTVVALYDDAATDDVLVPWGTPGLSARTSAVLVDVVDSVPTAQARQALDTVLHDHPLVQVDSLAERRGELTSSLNELLGIFAALLGMAVVIAMFGIGNTLSLSVFERTRESATLRALGLSRRQLRGMFLVEAALMAVLGSLAGVAFGVTVGWAAALGLIDAYGHGTPTVPVGQLLVYVGLATVAALLAGLLPARQATRAEIIVALSR